MRWYLEFDSLRNANDSAAKSVDIKVFLCSCEIDFFAVDILEMVS